MRAMAMVGIGAALVALVPAQARAEPVGVVVVARDDAPVTAAATRAAVAAAVGDPAETAPFALARRRQQAGAVPASRLGDVGRAEALLAQGWQSYLEVRPSLAASRLAEARSAAVAVADLPGGPARVADISLRLGAIELELGRTAEAADDLRLAAVLAPEREVTAREFKPEVVAAFAAAVALAPGSGRLAVTPAAPGAMVSIDGGTARLAPVELEVDDGVHLVVIRAPGRRSAAALVSVAAGGRAAIEPALEVDADRAALEAGASLAFGTSERDATGALEAALRYGELAEIIIAAPVWRRGAPALLVQACAGVPLRCSAVSEVGFAAAALGGAARSAVARARTGRRGSPVTLTADLRVAAGEGPPGAAPPPDGDDRAWWQSGWLWAGVGGAVLTAAAVVVLVDDGELRPVITGDPCQFRVCP